MCKFMHASLIVYKSAVVIEVVCHRKILISDIKSDNKRKTIQFATDIFVCAIS
jgi:hypothetical protein